MGKGGARNRSGPGADPMSIRSAQREFSLTALPADGYKGDVPEFPLPRVWRWTDEWTDKVKSRVTDADATEGFRARELEIWVDSWESPQAEAWARESWRWTTIGEYCRLKTIVELEPDANASLVAQLHRYRDQIGLTPAGLKENGWAISADQVGSSTEPDIEDGPKQSSARGRIRVVPSAGGS